MLDFSKESTFKNECVVEYKAKYEPMIISCKMKHNSEQLVKHKQYDQPIKDTFQVGNWIYGLFKAQIKIQKERKRKEKEQC